MWGCVFFNFLITVIRAYSFRSQTWPRGSGETHRDTPSLPPIPGPHKQLSSGFLSFSGYSVCADAMLILCWLFRIRVLFFFTSHSAHMHALTLPSSSKIGYYISSGQFAFSFTRAGYTHTQLSYNRNSTMFILYYCILFPWLGFYVPPTNSASNTPMEVNFLNIKKWIHFSFFFSFWRERKKYSPSYSPASSCQALLPKSHLETSLHRHPGNPLLLPPGGTSCFCPHSFSFLGPLPCFNKHILQQISGKDFLEHNIFERFLGTWHAV